MRLNGLKSLAVVALTAMLVMGVQSPVYAQKAKKEKAKKEKEMGDAAAGDTV